MRANCFLALFVLATWNVIGAPSPGVALIVPAYFDPASGNWQRLAAAATKVPLIAIANLVNGPGSGTNPVPAYATAIESVRQSGGAVIGYVYTHYANRAWEEVEADVFAWHTRYPLDGIFVDEMSNQTNAEILQYYSRLYNYIRSLNAAYLILANPGVNTQESYLKLPTADGLVIFENGSGYPDFVPSPWTQRYPPSQFCHLLYSVSSAAEMKRFVDLAISRRAGLVYVTDDNGDNPWDTLPSYWDQEIEFMVSINQAVGATQPIWLAIVLGTPPLLTMTARGPAGRNILETETVLGEWRPVATNLTRTGESKWTVLPQLISEQFFRVRRD